MTLIEAEEIAHMLYVWLKRRQARNELITEDDFLIEVIRLLIKLER